MTESVVTISPKTSPYRSQIHPRLASTGSSSSVNQYIPPSSRNRNHDQQLLSNEKLQLRKLNDKFLSYIERVRLFETYNNCLTIHCEQVKIAQERTKTKLDLLKQEFDEYQQERCVREQKDLQLENENINEIEKQVDEYKNRESVLQHKHQLHRKQIIGLQKESVDLQAKTEQLRFDYENLNDDNNHYRKKISYCQLLKSSILDEITRQRDLHQSIQLEVDDLKMQKQISIQAHEADTQAIEIHNDNILCDLTANFRFDSNGKNVLTQMLNEIREEYKTKDNEMRDELHRKYLYEYNQHIKKQVDQNLIETNREDIERRQLSNELNSLNDNRLLLRQKVALIQEHHKQLEINLEREMRKQKNMQEKYDQQIDDLRVSVREYENLLSNSSLNRQSTIETEVNKYRQLLEGSDQQLGLRQLIKMSTKIDRSSPNHRPQTPPPSLMEKIESASTFLLRPSHTRQNSISENSYETAPISQSSTSTTNNQQYLTLDSPNDQWSHTDYDTDNDQSQTIQYMSGRSSRLISETDTASTAMTPTNQESLPPFPSSDLTNHNETVVELSIDTTHTDGQINETLPFTPMNLVSQIDGDENKTIVLEQQQQSPLISTLENREELEKTNGEPTDLPLAETIVPITIDIESKPIEEPIEVKIVSLSTPTSTVDEQPKTAISPTIVSDQPETESTVVEVPISTLPATNPLAKLISTMLPNAVPFVPILNTTDTRPVSPLPIPIAISTMNNDAPSFVPSPSQYGNGQTHLNNNHNNGHWNGTNIRGGNTGGNRRGQIGTNNFHQGGGGGGGQRSGGGNNWNQGGGTHHKQRRGMK